MSNFAMFAQSSSVCVWSMDSRIVKLVPYLVKGTASGNTDGSLHKVATVGLANSHDYN